MHGIRLAVAALAVGLAACGGGDDPEDFGERVVEAFCEREARCGVYSSADTCEDTLLEGDGDVWMGLGTRHETALASGRLSFDKEAARRCVEAIRDRDCRLPALSRDAMVRGIEYDPSCRQVLRVQRLEEACRAHVECGESGFCLYTWESGCQGTCAPRYGEGALSQWPLHCGPGLVINVDEGVCQRPRDEAEACRENIEGYVSNSPCAPGLWCDWRIDTCRWSGSEGDACSHDPVRPCGESFVCVAERCERRAPKGAACRAYWDRASTSYASSCQLDLFCDADNQQSGVCRERREEGSACRNLNECATDLYCADARPESGTWGRCQKRSGPGESCKPDSEAGPVANCLAGHACSPETGRCMPFVREGERCSQDAQCATGSCSSQGRCSSPETSFCE